MNAPDTQSSRHFPLVQKSGGNGGFYAPIRKLIGQMLLKRLDSGMEQGCVEGHLPDGSVRLLGGRGAGPHAIVHLKSWNALLRLARAGSVGWYEAWEAGEWSSPDPVPLFDLFMRNRVALGKAARPQGVARILGKMLNWHRRNTRSGSRRNIGFHYDLGNDFYSSWLDESMTYSSAIFDAAKGDGDLVDAQRNKNALLLARLNLQESDHLLEIGCGWGGLGEQALQSGDIRYHGITVSSEQMEFAQARLAKFGDRAQISFTDYRDVDGKYDAVASVEMVEAVGQQYWPDYLDAIRRALKPGGRAALQYIRIEDDVFEAYASGQDFIQKYIFPGGMLLSESRFRKLAEERGLSWADQSDYGLHYAETLKQWRARFDTAIEDGRLPAQFDERFVRLWRYYLMYCEGGFRGGGINVAQVTLVKA